MARVPAKFGYGTATWSDLNLAGTVLQELFPLVSSKDLAAIPTAKWTYVRMRQEAEEALGLFDYQSWTNCLRRNPVLVFLRIFLWRGESLDYL